VDLPPPPTLPAVEDLRIDRLSREGQTLVVEYGAVTNVPARLVIALRPLGGTTWQAIDGGTESTAFDTPAVRLSIGLGPQAGTRFAVRIQVAVKKADGTFDTPQTVEQDEAPATDP
jgi:hypothetical protein